MNALLIFDGRFESLETPFNHKGEVQLFPLTDDWLRIGRVRDWAKGSGTTTLCDSSRRIEKEVDRLQMMLPQWSVNLSKRQIYGKSMKEHFLVGGSLSAWWFSFFAERNPLKTNVFLSVAQLQALETLLNENRFDTLHLALAEGPLRSAVERLGERRGLVIQHLPVGTSGGGKRNAIGYPMEAWGRFCIFLYQAVKVRVRMAFVHRKRVSRPILFVSYFPWLDEEEARAGRFRNKFALPLQDKLIAMQRSVVWILMTIPIGGKSFNEFVTLARRLAKAGEPVFLLQEFLTVRGWWRALVAWLRVLRKSISLSKGREKDFLSSGLAIPEAEELLWPLWWESFAGWTGFNGLLFLELYSEMFRRYPDAADCLYYAEMHGWEKSLNTAKKDEANAVRTIGFQHAAFSRNHFTHFFAAEETRRTGQATDMPLPDILACNGKRSETMFAPQGFPALRRVEGVRQMHLAKILKSDLRPKVEPPIVLLAGTIAKGETISLVQMLMAAALHSPGFEIWFKPHPSMTADSLFETIGHRPQGWKMCASSEPIDQLLSSAAVLVTGESSVAIDALAYGCQVVVPVLSNTVTLSPMLGSEEMYFKVYSPDELRIALENILIQKIRKTDVAKARQFVESWWTLDESLPLWEKLLS